MQSYGTVPNVTSDFFLQGLVGPQGLKGNQVTYCLQCLAYYKNKVTNVIVADHLCTHTCVISFIKQFMLVNIITTVGIYIHKIVVEISF